MPDRLGAEGASPFSLRSKSDSCSCFFPSSLLSQEWNTNLLSRILLFLLRTHHNQIVSNNVMRPTIIALRTHLRSALRRQKETVGYNLAGLKFIQRKVVEDSNAEFWEMGGTEEEVRERIEEGKKKRKRVVV